MVADQWSSLLDENARMEQKVRDLDSKLEHYRKIEEALQEALETARDNSHKTIENAQREAQIIIREARSEAEELRKKGAQDHKRLKHDITKVSGRRDEVIARLRAFLMSEMELLARFEGQDHIGSGYVRLHSADRKQLESRSYNDDLLDDDYEVRPTVKQTHSINDVSSSYEVDIPLNEANNYDSRSSKNDRFSSTSHVSTPIGSGLNDSDAPLNNSSAGTKPESNEGPLSSDEIDFIKSTVETSSADSNANELFKSQKPGRNGHSRSEAEAEEFTLNDRFARTKDASEKKMGQPQSDQRQQMRSVENTKDGWVVRTMTDDANTSTPTSGSAGKPPPNNRGFTSQIFGADGDDDLSATPEEIEKIRRILNDLD